MDQNLMKDIEAFVEEKREFLLRDIARLVAINSVEGEPEPGSPFGAGPRAALDTGLTIARELGLEAVDCQGYMGYAALGSGDRYLATITHLDVVPAGEGWSADPFTLRRKEDAILGRGVMDDKGPSVVCLYALHYLKERGVSLHYPIRALLGVNEETHMGDVRYYLAHEPAPLFCFSPDAEFPLCNGEKGICHGRLISTAARRDILDISAAPAANVIPARARCLVKAAASLPSTECITACAAGDGLWELTAQGVGGHASLPEGTVNALGLLVKYLLEQGIGSEGERAFLHLLDKLHSASDGSALGAAADDGLFKPLTIVGTQASIDGEQLCQVFDCRYPTTMSGEKLRNLIAAQAGDAAEILIDSDKEPFYISTEDPAIQACLRAYRSVTGENEAQPYTIGGGTYARLFPRAVAFGPEHPERPMPDFVGPIHGADEGALVSYLLEALKVYIVALLELEKLDL